MAQLTLYEPGRAAAADQAPDREEDVMKKYELHGWAAFCHVAGVVAKRSLKYPENAPVLRTSSGPNFIGILSTT